MSFNLEIFNSLPCSLQHEYAGLIADYTQGKLGETPQMLPVEPSDIYQKYIGIVALDGDAFMGYVGAMQPEEHNGQALMEVGSLWVPAEHRHRGVAHELVTSVTLVLSALGKRPYAFCNPLSENIFKQSDYVESSPEEVPPSAFSICASCPMKPADGGCCDKILISKGVTK